MNSLEKTIKIVKRHDKDPLVDQTQHFLKTDKQSKREIARVVASWIEERRQAVTERPENRAYLF
jgi:hypothetical protein